VFIAVVWVIQEFTSFHVLKYVILFIGETEDVLQSCSLYFNFWNANYMVENECLCLCSFMCNRCDEQLIFSLW